VRVHRLWRCVFARRPARSPSGAASSIRRQVGRRGGRLVKRREGAALEFVRQSEVPSVRRDGGTRPVGVALAAHQRGGDRKIHLCDSKHVPIDEVDSELRPPDFRFSAYTLWDQMADHRNEYFFDGLINSPTEALVKAAKAQLRKHFDDRHDDLSQRLIAQWKAEQVYPYGGEPQSEAESVERALFNVVSTQIQQHLPQTRQGKQITLNLLKGSLQHQPEEITHILSSVLHLSPDDRSQLARLLARTSLAGVIRTASSVANRLDFLAALEQMVFDPVTSGLIQGVCTCTRC
jgi:hypothetical protein